MENENNPQTLSVNDLYVIKQIIETCAQRGAFNADEMVVVGSVYQKLLKFLKTIEPIDEEDADGDTNGDTDAEVSNTESQ